MPKSEIIELERHFQLFNDPTLQKAGELIQQKLQENELTLSIDFSGSPTLASIMFHRYNPDLNLIEGRIAHTDIYFDIKGGKVIPHLFAQKDDLTGLKNSQKVLALGFSGMIGELLTKVQFQGESPKDIDFAEILENSVDKARQILNNMEPKTGLEKNKGYQNWEKWLKTMLGCIDLKLITGVDPINNTIIQKVVSKYEYSQYDINDDTPTFMSLKIPKGCAENGDVETVLYDKVLEATLPQRAVIKTLSRMQTKAVRAFLEGKDLDPTNLREEFYRLYIGWYTAENKHL